LIPVFIVALVLIFAQRKRRQHMELINRFVENGQEVPRELLISGDSADAVGKDANMKRGLVLMGVGLGVLIALGMLAGWDVGALGLIPFFIGLARLIIWTLEKDRTDTISGTEV
jgi:hypothetical protein